MYCWFLEWLLSSIMESSYLENYMRFSDSTATRFPNRI